MSDTGNYNSPLRSQITKDEIMIPPTPNLHCLGNGTGVNVWQLQNKVRSPWAVKNVRSTMETSFKNRFQGRIVSEAVVLADIHHENIVGYRGLLKSVDGRQCLAMESCGRSLGDLVEDREDTLMPFTPREILIVVRSIAKALNYLHMEKRLLHGDIKPTNILVKGDFEVVKLCDFGVSLRLNEEGFAEGYVGTSVYHAPEVAREEDDITPACEIFSMGLTIWEMLALRPPHCDNLETSASDSMKSLQSTENSTLSSIESLLNIGTRPELPPGLGADYEAIIKMFMACTEEFPSNRPTAAELASIADEILKTL